MEQNSRIVRNSPCPCGSGKKYKRCHGDLVAAQSSRSTHTTSAIDPKEKGKEFETSVFKLLKELASKHSQSVVLETQPRIVLQNDEVVIPDFHLTVELIHQRSHYLIECQHREHHSKSILHKIQHVRSKQKWKTFLFLYPESIPPELVRAIEGEGVMHLNLSDFALFIRRLDVQLEFQPDITGLRSSMLQPSRSKPDGAMLASPRKR